MKDMTFEKALEKLEKIVEDLEAGDLPLDDALKKYEDGVKLVRTCQQKLKKAKKKIELLMKDEKGDFEKRKFED